jgi:ABC-type sugar transport system permease subunit
MRPEDGVNGVPGVAMTTGPDRWPRPGLLRRHRTPLLLLLPSLVLLSAVVAYPILDTFITAFYKTDPIGRRVAFVGLDHFWAMARDPVFRDILGQTVFWTVLSVLLKTVFGLTTALVLHTGLPGMRIARLLIILPWAFSLPIAAILWRWVYDSQMGMLNLLLTTIGLPALTWLADPKLAFGATLAVSVWTGVPFMALVFLAGLQGIPQDLYEAGRIDGAGWWQEFGYLTLPLLKPTFVVATLLSAVWTFNSFVLVHVITGGGPLHSTDILVTFLYKTAFEWLSFGPASAMALVIFFILLVFSLTYVRLYYRKEMLSE